MDKLKFMNLFIKIYGLKNLADFTTKISTKQFDKNTLFLDRINTEIPKIKKMFKISQMSLAKNNYMIKTPLQAFQLLKHCLQQLNIGFQKFKTNNTNYLRLISPNFMYINYIKSMSTSGYVDSTTNIVITNIKSIDLEEKYNVFDDYISKFKIIRVCGKNNDILKAFIDPKNETYNDPMTMVGNKTQYEKTIIGKEFIIKDDRIFVLIEIPQSYDLVDDIRYQIINSDSIIDEEGTCDILSENHFCQTPFPLITAVFDKISAILEFPININLQNKISLSYDGIFAHSEVRRKLAQLGWTLKNEKVKHSVKDNTIKLVSGMSSGDNKFITEKKGTLTFGIKFSGLKGQWKIPRFVKSVSNIRFKAVTSKDVLGNQTKIRWIMASLYINDNKIMYCKDHYNDIAIPLYALFYSTVHFDIELSNGLSFDRNDYIEITFDYNNSENFKMDDKILYSNFKTVQGCFGPIYT